MALIRSSNRPDTATGTAHWFVFRENELVVPLSSGDAIEPIVLPFGEKLPFSVAAEEYLGVDGDIHYFAADLGDTELDESVYRVSNLRIEYKHITFEQFRLFGYAVEVIHWTRNFRFCGKCGTPTKRLDTERAMRCPSCGLMAFPRLSPAIIVAITHEDKILLAHNKHFKENQYSTLAGFIDPGENAEEAVQREIMEEVGVTVTNIQYVTSQPWPFPDSLMLGYTAEYVSGEITPDGVEILDARWFAKEDLDEVLIPSKQAVARTLIEKVFGPIDRE